VKVSIQKDRDVAGTATNTTLILAFVDTLPEDTDLTIDDADEPINEPAVPPTKEPTSSPTRKPTMEPTTSAPTRKPIPGITDEPTNVQTNAPTGTPTVTGPSDPSYVDYDSCKTCTTEGHLWINDLPGEVCGTDPRGDGTVGCCRPAEPEFTIELCNAIRRLEGYCPDTPDKCCFACGYERGSWSPIQDECRSELACNSGSDQFNVDCLLPGAATGDAIAVPPIPSQCPVGSVILG
jgi:hypothetical protein